MKRGIIPSPLVFFYAFLIFSEPSSNFRRTLGLSPREQPCRTSPTSPWVFPPLSYRRGVPPLPSLSGPSCSLRLFFPLVEDGTCTDLLSCLRLGDTQLPNPLLTSTFFLRTLRAPITEAPRVPPVPFPHPGLSLTSFFAENPRFPGFSSPPFFLTPPVAALVTFFVSSLHSDALPVTSSCKDVTFLRHDCIFTS